MKEKDHFIDRFGRIIIPAHIRKQMNIGVGKVINMTVKNGVLHIKAIPARCCVCGGDLEKKPHASLGEKDICYDCATKIVAVFEKGGGESNGNDND